MKRRAAALAFWAAGAVAWAGHPLTAADEASVHGVCSGGEESSLLQHQMAAHAPASPPAPPAQGKKKDERCHVDKCANMKNVTFRVKGFSPMAQGLPGGSVDVYGCSFNALGTGKHVVLWLHGAGGSADDYARMAVAGKVKPLPDYDIIFLSSPRTNCCGKTGYFWMCNQNKLENKPPNYPDDHWNNEVVDSVTLVTMIVDQAASKYGGYDHVWVAGFSQGAVISSAVNLRGSSQLLAGGFAAAGYPPQMLYSNAAGAKPPPGWWSAQVRAAKGKTNQYFVTGDDDVTLPYKMSFCRYKHVLDALGIQKGNFWTMTDYNHFADDQGHPAISPSSDGVEFQALWRAVQGQSLTNVGRRGSVELIPKATTPCPMYDYKCPVQHDCK